MTRAALVRRVVALELGPTSFKSIEGWAEVYGWNQVLEWKKNRGARAIAKLLPMLGEVAEAIPEETPLEHQFHEAMAAAYPADPGTRARLCRMLGLSGTGDDL